MSVEMSAPALRPVNTSPTSSSASLSDRTPAKALKICLLGYRSHPHGGGQGIYLRYLSKALVEAGHQVDVISGQPYPHLDARVRLIKMPSLNLYETGLSSLRPTHLKSLTNIIEWTGKLSGGFTEPYCFGRRAYKYLRRHGADYDIIHDNQCLSWGLLKLQQRGFPLVTTIHHPITSDLSIALKAASSRTERLLIRRWHAFLGMQQKVARKLDHIITVSQCSRQDIAEAFSVKADRIELVYNGIDTEEFRPLPEVARKPFRIMTTASADAPLKGVRYLLEAMSELVPGYPELELLLVGRPRPGGETDRLITDLELTERVKCVSGISTEELVKYYAEAQVVVVPSVYEGFGLPAGEAMACGVPVIATRGGALPEVVGDVGILVPVKDSAAIARELAALFESPDRREQLSLGGRARIQSRFSWQRTAQEMTDYYWRVLGEQKRIKALAS